MENVSGPTVGNQFSKHERKIFLSVLFVLGLIAIIFFLVIPILKPKLVPLSLLQTVGIDASSEFQFTLSPDNKWILYFETNKPLEQYNLVAFNTVSKKKFTIDTKNVITAQLRFQMKNNCWSKDSKYCVLPIGFPRTDPRIVERLSSIQSPAGAPWIKGNLLGESEFTDIGGASGYPNNAPDILIDFSNPESPTLKTQYFDYSLVDPSRQHINTQNTVNRLTFDQISPDGFTCSDCIRDFEKEKDFGGNSHGREYISPDGRFIAQEISHGSGFVTPPDLYIKDTTKLSSTFVASNVYYDLHFTSDSKGVYYYGCEVGGGCKASQDHLFYAHW